MAFRLLAQSLKRAVPLASRAASTNAPVPTSGAKTENNIYRDQVGSRDYPLPDIRWREDTSEIAVLREKEKGDWRNLTKEEKIVLHRASLCQTSFGRTSPGFDVPTGEWKIIISASLIALGVALWFTIWINVYVYPPRPERKKESLKAQLKRKLDLGVGGVDGLSSK